MLLIIVKIFWHCLNKHLICSITFRYYLSLIKKKMLCLLGNCVPPFSLRWYWILVGHGWQPWRTEKNTLETSDPCQHLLLSASGVSIAQRQGSGLSEKVISNPSLRDEDLPAGVFNGMMSCESSWRKLTDASVSALTAAAAGPSSSTWLLLRMSTLGLAHLPSWKLKLW